MQQSKISFDSLLSSSRRTLLRQTLGESVVIDDTLTSALSTFKSRWQSLKAASTDNWVDTVISQKAHEDAQVDWLIELFDCTFARYHTHLVRSAGEPEYFPATNTTPARIAFAHGFFASALHEISHWCVAGAHRRTLPDFGYWYAPDGRTQAQQAAFEQVEIKPQAIECLLTLACGRNFSVSQDNLFANFDTSKSTFAQDVYNQVEYYIDTPHHLPRDARTLLWVLLTVCWSEPLAV